jgi:hypothetical protein
MADSPDLTLEGGSPEPADDTVASQDDGPPQDTQDAVGVAYFGDGGLSLRTDGTSILDLVTELTSSAADAEDVEVGLSLELTQQDKT